MLRRSPGRCCASYVSALMRRRIRTTCCGSLPCCQMKRSPALRARSDKSSPNESTSSATCSMTCGSCSWMLASSRPRSSSAMHDSSSFPTRPKTCRCVYIIRSVEAVPRLRPPRARAMRKASRKLLQRSGDWRKQLTTMKRRIGTDATRSLFCDARVRAIELLSTPSASREATTAVVSDLRKIADEDESPTTTEAYQTFASLLDAYRHLENWAAAVRAAEMEADRHRRAGQQLAKDLLTTAAPAGVKVAECIVAVQSVEEVPGVAK